MLGNVPSQAIISGLFCLAWWLTQCMQSKSQCFENYSIKRFVHFFGGMGGGGEGMEGLDEEWKGIWQYDRIWNRERLPPDTVYERCDQFGILLSDNNWRYWLCSTKVSCSAAKVVITRGRGMAIPKNGSPTWSNLVSSPFINTYASLFVVPSNNFGSSTNPPCTGWINRLAENETFVAVIFWSFQEAKLLISTGQWPVTHEYIGKNKRTLRVLMQKRL